MRVMQVTRYPESRPPLVYWNDLINENKRDSESQTDHIVEPFLLPHINKICICGGPLLNMGLPFQNAAEPHPNFEMLDGSNHVSAEIDQESTASNINSVETVIISGSAPLSETDYNDQEPYKKEPDQNDGGESSMSTESSSTDSTQIRTVLQKDETRQQHLEDYLEEDQDMADADDRGESSSPDSTQIRMGFQKDETLQQHLAEDHDMAYFDNREESSSPDSTQIRMGLQKDETQQQHLEDDQDMAHDRERDQQSNTHGNDNPEIPWTNRLRQLTKRRRTQIENFRFIYKKKSSKMGVPGSRSMMSALLKHLNKYEVDRITLLTLTQWLKINPHIRKRFMECIPLNKRGIGIFENDNRTPSVRRSKRLSRQPPPPVC